MADYRLYDGNAEYLPFATLSQAFECKRHNPTWRVQEWHEYGWVDVTTHDHELMQHRKSYRWAQRKLAHAQ